MAIELAGREDNLVERDAQPSGNEFEKASLEGLAPFGVAESPFGNAATGGELQLRQPQRTAEAGQLGAIRLQ